jgi:hypothetical protein
MAAINHHTGSMRAFPNFTVKKNSLGEPNMFGAH